MPIGNFLIIQITLNLSFSNRLFLGPCNSVQVTEVMKKSFDMGLRKVALRFNSIEIDYKTIAKMPVLGRKIQLNACAVRLDIYNSLSFEFILFILLSLMI
jgi:hypothetical protein